MQRTAEKIVAGALSAFASISIGCSTASRYRVIVYDQSWSSEAAVQNLWCASDFKKACAQEARNAEQNFPESISKAFHAAPECATVRFLVLSDRDQNSQDLESRLRKNPGLVYWRLRVDFHPGLKRQPFTLGPGMKAATNEGDDAEHDVSYICDAAKNNGVTDYW